MPLNRKLTRRIVDIQFRQIQQRLAEAGIQLEATPEVLDYLGEPGFDPQFGARPPQARVTARDSERAVEGHSLRPRF